jgi:hypothetical protein
MTHRWTENFFGTYDLRRSNHSPNGSATAALLPLRATVAGRRLRTFDQIHHGLPTATTAAGPIEREFAVAEQDSYLSGCAAPSGTKIDRCYVV